MDNNTSESQKVQHQIKRFSCRITKGLSKPKKKFLSQLLFGIQASRDIKLSNIARSLKEDIRLIKTENRLSRHMISKDLTQPLNDILIDQAKGYIDEDTVLALDLSDINKPFAKKMDYLASVWDGSEGKPAPGYWLCEVIAAHVDKEDMVPLYSELYSCEAEHFESENKQIFKAIEAVNRLSKGKGVWVIDRGGDRPILVDKLSSIEQKFVIRIKDNRSFRNDKGEDKTIPQILRLLRYRDSFKLTVDKEGYKETIEVHLSVKHDLWMSKTKVSLVVIKGFGQKPMLLISNTEKTAQQILEIYLTRWKCEEAFRFLKHEYHLEDVRVRRYNALRNTVVLLHAVFYFVSVYLGRRLRLSILLSKIIEKAKRFFEVPVFKHYAVADGIYRLLFNQKWDAKDIEEPQEKYRQFSFEFA